MKTQYFQTSFKQIPVEDSIGLMEKSEAEKAKVKGTIVKGYASTPTKDRCDDIVEPVAFAESIQNNYRKNPIILFQHRRDRPIGKATYMSIDDKGLYIEGLIVDGEIEGKIQAGILKTFSIGYIPKEWEFQDKDGNALNPKNSDDRERIWYEEGVTRVIKKLELVENSIVSVPANPDALFDMAKSIKSFFDKEIFDSLPENEKESIIKSNTNPSIMKKDKNLLEKKEEEETQGGSQEEEAAEEEEVEESEEAEKTDSENNDSDDSEKEESTEEEKPADDETSEGEEGDEKSADDSKKEAEAEDSDVEKALSEYSENEKSIIKEMMMPENAAKAFDTIRELTILVNDLKAVIANTPAKKALAYFESGLNGTKKVGVDNPVQDKEGEESKDEEDKKGFISTMKENAV